MDLSAPVSRLDTLCDVFHALARSAGDRGWPPAAMQAAGCLARELEQLAGDLDVADDPQHARSILDRARGMLPPSFEAFGRAFAESLQSDVRIRRLRRNRDPKMGPLR
jgi:hypothetical protein